MRERAASLATAQAAAADLAVILATVRAALGGTEGRAAGNLLEMAKLDALSARDAIEKAIWEMDLTPSETTDAGWETGPLASPPRRAATPGPGQPSVVVLSPRLVRRSRRPVIVVGQGELF